MAERKRDPALQTEHRSPRRAHRLGRALRMSDTTPRRHEVHCARHDLLDVTFAVPMQDASIEQVGDRSEADVRMRPHIQAVPGNELHGAEMVEEDERANHLALAVRQRPPHLEPVTEVARSGHENQLQRLAGFPISDNRIVRRKPAHVV